MGDLRKSAPDKTFCNGYVLSQKCYRNMSRKNNNTSDRPASTKTARDWCFTLSLTLEDVHWTPQSVSDDCVKYMVCQLERAPSTGTLHYQGFIKFKNAVRMTGCKRILGSNQVNVRVRNGTQDEARNYCMKEETRVAGPFEFGNWDGSKDQGKRTDLETIYKLVKEGKSSGEIMEAFPSQYLRYHAGIDKAVALTRTANAPEVRPMKAFIYWGVRGSGKTTAAREKALASAKAKGQDKCYEWPDQCGQPVGYNGEKVVIIEEFNGWIPASTLKKILDIHRTNMKVPYCTVPWMAEEVYITSQYDPRKWYSDKREWAAIERRLDPEEGEVEFAETHPDVVKRLETRQKKVFRWSEAIEVASQLLSSGLVPEPGVSKWIRPKGDGYTYRPDTKEWAPVFDCLT